MQSGSMVTLRSSRQLITMLASLHRTWIKSWKDPVNQLSNNENVETPLRATLGVERRDDVSWSKKTGSGHRHIPMALNDARDESSSSETSVESVLDNPDAW